MIDLEKCTFSRNFRAKIDGIVKKINSICIDIDNIARLSVCVCVCVCVFVLFRGLNSISCTAYLYGGVVYPSLLSTDKTFDISFFRFWLYDITKCVNFEFNATVWFFFYIYTPCQLFKTAVIRSAFSVFHPGWCDAFVMAKPYNFDFFRHSRAHPNKKKGVFIVGFNVFHVGD